MKKQRLNYTILVVLIIFYIWVFRKSSSTRKEYAAAIEKNIGYAIGRYYSTITSYSRGGGTSNYINFKIKNTAYWRVKTKGLNYSDLDAKRGDQFLVIYDKLDPEICQMLFDYPIKDSTDFKRYLDEFKKTPLDVKQYFIHEYF